MCVPPSCFIGFTRKFRNHCSLHFCLCHFSLQSPLLQIKINRALVGCPSSNRAHGVISQSENNDQNATSASRAYSEPPLFVSFDLVIQQHMISSQHVLGIEATDTMFVEVSFVQVIPIELDFGTHSPIVYIKCTYKAIVYETY
jgi:hypothetical protein